MMFGHLSDGEIREELIVALGILRRDWPRLVREVEELELGSSRAVAEAMDLADVEIPDVAAVNLPVQNHGYGIEGRDLDLFIGLALSVGLSVLCVIYSYWL